MALRKTLSNLFRSSTGRQVHRRRANHKQPKIFRRRAILEQLEDRRLLTVFSNFNGVTIPASGTGPGASSPLYSEISVSGLPSTINYIQVELVNLSHTYPDDIDAYFGSAATGHVLLMSDAGGSNDLNNTTLVFVPNSFSSTSLPDSGQIIASTATSPITYYRGTNYNSDEGAGYPTDLGVFHGMSPNQTWRIDIRDDASGDSGRLQGWYLTVLTAPYNVSAGGTYSISEGNSVSLAASAKDNDGQTLTYSWDLNNDGIYGDASGRTPTVSWSTLQSLGIRDNGSYNVRVRVSDGYSSVTSAATTLSIANTAPTGTLSISGPATEGGSVTAALNNVFDPSAADTSSGLRYSFATSTSGLATSYSAASSTKSRDFSFPGFGTYTIWGRVFDKNGGFNTYSAVVTLADDDVAPPAISISGSNGTEQASANQQFIWSITDASGSTSDVVIKKNGVAILTRHYDSNVSLDFFDFNALGVGTYTLTISSTDRDNDRPQDQLSATAYRLVNVINDPPTASFSIATPLNLRTEGNAVSFDASASSDPEGDTLSFAWAFGDGATGSGLTPSHVYADNGDYSVTLTVTDQYGNTGAASQSVAITNLAPSANFSSSSPATDGSSATVFFTASTDPSSADTAASLRYSYDFDNDGVWDLGNGSYAGAVTSSSASVPASLLQVLGTSTMRGRIIDKNGGFTDYLTSLIVGDDDSTAPLITLTGRSGVTADVPEPFGWAIADVSGLSSISVTITRDQGNGAETLFTATGVENAVGSFDFSSHGLGVFTIQVVATDADNDRVDDMLTSSASRTISVVLPQPNTSPVANAADITLPENGHAIVALTGSDLESPLDLLTYTIVTVPTMGVLIDSEGDVVEVGDRFTADVASLKYQLRYAFGNAVDSFRFTVADSGNPSVTVTNTLISEPATVTINLPAISEGVLRIGGTDGADNISVAPGTDGFSLNVVVNDVQLSNTPSITDISLVSIYGGDGDDFIGITSIGPLFTIDGGFGFDTITLTNLSSFDPSYLGFDGIHIPGLETVHLGIDAISLDLDFNFTQISAAAANGILTVQGSELADDIRIRQVRPQPGSPGNIEVYERDTWVGTFDASGITRIDVHAAGDNDQVNLAYDSNAIVSVPSHIYGEAGNDILIGGRGSRPSHQTARE